MSVTEVAGGGMGGWSVVLSADTPRYVLDQIDYFGHIAVTSGQDNPVVSGDSILFTDGARFVGPLTGINFDDGSKEIRGFSMNFWLGDANNIGTVAETELYFNNISFTSAITQSLSSSVQVGSIEPLAGLHRGQYLYKDSREIISYICSLYGAEFYVRNDSRINVGTPAFLYGSTPTVAVIRHVEGFDLDVRALPGIPKLAADVEDFTTRLLMIANASQGDAQVVTSSANIATALNPYKDMFGNSINRTRTMQENDTSDYNAAARAQINLDRFVNPNEVVTLDLKTSDVRGDLRAGSYIWIHDEETKLVDLTNPQRFRGEDLYPVKFRVFELTWPIEQGMGVYFRHYNGTWIDLTPWVQFESNDASVTIGGYDRTITGATGGGISVTKPPDADTSIPAAPTWNLPFAQSLTLSTVDGTSVVQVILTWNQPLNTDSTVIADGDHYEIRYRKTGLGDWQFAQVGFDFVRFNLQELTPGIFYQFEIRAIDSAKPPNRGAWSATASLNTAGDLIPPSAPAAPTVAGNLVSVQITHTLGKSTGGTYNLEADIDHLNIHALANFGDAETNLNKIGELPCRAALQAQIPAIGTFQISALGPQEYSVVAVDISGNKSPASNSSTVSALLISASYVSSVFATSIQTGNLTAVLALVGAIQTASSGSRFRADNLGWKLFRPSGTQSMFGQAATGDLIGYAADGVTQNFLFSASTGNIFAVGEIQTSLGPDKVLVTNVSSPRISFSRSASSAAVAFMTGVGDGVDGRLDLLLHAGSHTSFSPNRTGKLRLSQNGFNLGWYDVGVGVSDVERGVDLSCNQRTFSLSIRNDAGQVNGTYFDCTQSNTFLDHTVNGVNRNELGLQPGVYSYLNAKDSSANITSSLTLYASGQVNLRGTGSQPFQLDAGAGNGQFQFRGKFRSNAFYLSDDAILTGVGGPFNTGSGVNFVINFTYGPVMSGGLAPIVSLFDTGGLGAYSWMIVASSSSGFSVGINGSNRNVYVWYWVYRY